MMEAASNADGVPSPTADRTTRALTAETTKDRYRAFLSHLAAASIHSTDGAATARAPGSLAQGVSGSDAAHAGGALADDIAQQRSLPAHDASPPPAVASRFDLASMWPRGRARPHPLQPQGWGAEEARLTLALLALVLDCFTDVARYPRCAMAYLCTCAPTPVPLPLGVCTRWLPRRLRVRLRSCIEALRCTRLQVKHQSLLQTKGSGGSNTCCGCARQVRARRERGVHPQVVARLDDVADRRRACYELCARGSSVSKRDQKCDWQITRVM